MDIRTDKIKELKFLIDELEKHGIKLTDVYLFGSFSKNSMFNDIDVALVSDSFSGIRFFDMKKIIEILKKYPPVFDLHPFKTNDFYDDENFFTKEIIEKGERLLFN